AKQSLSGQEPAGPPRRAAHNQFHCDAPDRLAPLGACNNQHLRTIGYRLALMGYLKGTNVRSPYCIVDNTFRQMLFHADGTSYLRQLRTCRVPTRISEGM